MTGARLGVVVIGRNEGDRLRRCFDALPRGGLSVVYVDSGSVDDSVEQALRRGLEVVELDGAAAFTAGRARNAGFTRLLEIDPGLRFVQFIDGDCELVDGWLEAGASALESEPQIAAICGRVRERNREQTIYNLLCDLEWAAPAGETRQCGGNAMMRTAAFREAGGFRPGLIAGEEPELCLRLRRHGWRIFRIDRDMVFHDADMTRFGQWWRRALRAGWAYAERATLHGATPERHAVRENCSIFLWGAALPAAALGLAPLSGGLSLMLLLGYPLLAARIHRRSVRGGTSAQDAFLQAVFTVLAKFPQALGQLEFVVLRLLGRGRRVVDWRAPRTARRSQARVREPT
jgi:GT2 family glycosyltransferase